MCFFKRFGLKKNKKNILMFVFKNKLILLIVNFKLIENNYV